MFEVIERDRARKRSSACCVDELRAGGGVWACALGRGGQRAVGVKAAWRALVKRLMRGWRALAPWRWCRAMRHFAPCSGVHAAPPPPLPLEAARLGGEPACRGAREACVDGTGSGAQAERGAGVPVAASAKGLAFLCRVVGMDTCSHIDARCRSSWVSHCSNAARRLW